MRPAKYPTHIETIITPGRKVRFRAIRMGAPLRKSEWSACCDYRRAIGELKS